ncbi:OmpA family protein [Gynurincola endophyticus]|uniref:OmpA family protein n=1 Tax=Gynurincola endophyticus TaxID=2479004 RepID=UPI000F8E9299|nr:OmpA family protein [Gynurincola endophyticus]
MASKKYTSLFALLCLVFSGAYAQIGGTYDVQDSSYVPSNRLPQHAEFMANDYPFPAKPRNQWEIGLKGGLFNVRGDVASLPSWGAGLHVRKAIGYIFSIRGELGYNVGKGLNWRPSYAGPHDQWGPYTAPPGSASSQVFHNYKTTVIDGSLQGVITLNNLRFHKAKTGFNLYFFGGIGGMIYDTKLDILNSSGGLYNFSSALAIPNNRDNRKDIRKELKDNIFDGNYETDAPRNGDEAELFDKPFKPTVVFGAGMQFKLSDRVSLAIENKVTVPKSDLIDGVQFQETVVAGQAVRVLTPDKDILNNLSLGLNFNIGNKSKSVAPLWWLNPLDYAYNEINRPRHMKLPKPILDDSDGDGVPDQFDLEPNTPAGAAVNTRGVALDTDGDGVPDYRDKEKITPTQCQPVDADGVGTCPPPACCDEIKQMMENWSPKSKCNISALPSITFKGNTVALSNDSKALLASVAQQIKNSPDCKIAVVGYCASNKSQQQLSWDRVNAVINHLVEKEGISADRFIFKYGELGGDCNTVDLRDGTGEEGPTTVPAPHPNLRRRG